MATPRSVPEHQDVVAGLITAPAPQAVPLAGAAGRVLAGDYVAPRSLPSFDNSAMDGYAVRCVDVAGATEDDPAVLPVVEDIPAGRVEIPPLTPGTAHRIMTGSMMPVGADTVVQVEVTDGGTGTVRIFASARPGAYVRVIGEDVRAGETVLPAGSVLGPAQLAIIAAMGDAAVTVIPPLRVLVLSTGSELVEPGEEIRPGQIHESNGIMLSTAVEAAGGRAQQLHFVVDDVEAFHAALAPHLDDVDLVITSGGVSAGAYEVVKDALTGQGVEFTKVAMQPGMPQGAGTLRGVPVVTMPGNPVSAMVSFEVFVRPALRAAMGLPDIERPVRQAVVTQSLESPPGRRQFRRGVLDRTRDEVRPVGPAGSQYLRWLAVSNCLIDIPADTVEVPAGMEVDVWDLT